MLKDIILDLVVTAGILGMVLLDLGVLGVEGPVTLLWWVLTLYTGLLLLVKLGALLSARTLRQMNVSDSVSPLVHRVLYAINVLALLAGAFWLLSAGWIGIWALSEVLRTRTAQPATS